MSTQTVWFKIAPGIVAEYEFDDYELHVAQETRGSVHGKATGRVRVDLAEADQEY
ncbi:hypothetical protein [Streptomyces sennicomposti]